MEVPSHFRPLLFDCSSSFFKVSNYAKIYIYSIWQMLLSRAAYNLIILHRKAKVVLGVLPKDFYSLRACSLTQLKSLLSLLTHTYTHTPGVIPSLIIYSMGP